MSAYDDAFTRALGGSNGASAYDEAFKKVLAEAGSSDPSNTADPVADYSGNLRVATPFGTLDTRIPLPQGLNRRLAQFGSGMADYGMVTATPEEVDKKRQIDQLLNNDFSGKALSFGGKVAPALAVPTVGGPVIGGVLAGAAMGAAEPVGTGESRLTNTALGGVLGGALPGAIKGFQVLARPGEANQALARSALEKNIPVGVADITDSKFLKAVRSVLNDTPFVGNIGDAQRAATQQGFNRAVGGTFGAEATSLTPEVMQAAKTKIGAELNRVWEGNSLKIDPQFITELQAIQQKAAEKLNPEQAAMVNRHIQNLLGKSNNAEIPGGFANNWQSELRMAADSEKGLAQNVLGDLRKSALLAFNRGVSPEDAVALTKARSQYGALKTVQPLMNSAEAGIAGRTVGDVPAALLPNRIVQQYGSAARSPFGDLPQIGSQFLVNRTPQTGGSVRAGIQNALVGTGLLSGGGAAGGAAVAGGLGAGVGAVGGLTAAAVLQKVLGSPAIAQSVLKDPAMLRGLLDTPELGKALLELSKNSAYRLPTAASMGLLSTPALE